MGPVAKRFNFSRPSSMLPSLLFPAQLYATSLASFSFIPMRADLRKCSPSHFLRKSSCTTIRAPGEPSVGLLGLPLHSSAHPGCDLGNASPLRHGDTERSRRNRREALTGSPVFGVLVFDFGNSGDYGNSGNSLSPYLRGEDSALISIRVWTASYLRPSAANVFLRFLRFLCRGPQQVRFSVVGMEALLFVLSS